MPKSRSRKKQNIKNLGKVSTEFMDLTEEERVLLALEMSKAETNGHNDPALEIAMDLSKKNMLRQDCEGDLEAILQLSLNPQEQINSEHREFLSILTKVDSQASSNTSNLKRGDRQRTLSPEGLSLEELDEEEQLLIALRRSAKENQFTERLNSEERSTKKTSKAPSYKCIISRPGTRSEGGSSSSGSPLSTSPPTSSSTTPHIPRIVVSQTGGYSPYRPIVIDGCNMAWAHGNHRHFSAQGLSLAYKHFQSLGSREITIFIRNNPSGLNEEGERILEGLRDAKVLYEIPRNRTSAGFHVSHYDDLMIVDYATKVKGIVVSNDHFEDIIDHSKEFKDQIRYRLLSFTWVENMLLFPQDPLGKGGPSLKNFLKY